MKLFIRFNSTSHIQKLVYDLLSGIPNLSLLAPLDYLPLVHLLKHAALILTDSGGIQEEAAGLGIPCLVLRDVTERPEGVAAGVLKLVGTDTDRIVAEAGQVFSIKDHQKIFSSAPNPYGVGQSAPRIVQSLFEGISEA